MTAAILRERIESALSQNASGALNGDAFQVVDDLLSALESGEIRAAEKTADGKWNAVPWVKRGILLGFQIGSLTDMSDSDSIFRFFDKNTYPPRALLVEDGVRIVPGGSAIRRGAYVSPGVVCMPPMYTSARMSAKGQWSIRTLSWDRARKSASAFT
jgi:2,3,4,5-tetrahydropyridine-2-carboxylate N-succinyltransferase